MMSSRNDRNFNTTSMTRVLVPEEISILVSSNPNQGAQNVSADGSTFQIQLQDGIKVPADAKNVTVSVEEATVWWVVPNIITGQNDTFYITAPDTSDVLTNYISVIPQGLYDLSGLNNALLRDLENQGAKINPEPVLSLSPDDATQKVNIRTNYIGVSIDFTPNNTPREILGYDAQVYGPATQAPQNFLAPNVAQFNQVNYFLIHSDLVNTGLRLNDDYNQTIAQVLIDVAPGSQIVSTPFHPAKTNAPELAGAIRTTLRFQLTDDQNRPVNTNGEYWSARILISYLHAHNI